MQFTSTTAKKLLLRLQVQEYPGRFQLIPPQQRSDTASSEIPTDFNEEEEQTVFPESFATLMQRNSELGKSWAFQIKLVTLYGCPFLQTTAQKALRESYSLQLPRAK